MGYCLNVMRGCLASMAEIDTHWREFVHSLEGLSARMYGPHDLEQVLLGVHTLLRDAIGHAQKNGQWISAQVRSSFRRFTIVSVFQLKGDLLKVTNQDCKETWQKRCKRDFNSEKRCYYSCFLHAG